MFSNYEQALAAVENILHKFTDQEPVMSEIMAEAGVVDPTGKWGARLEEDLIRKNRIRRTEGGLAVFF